MFLEGTTYWLVMHIWLLSVYDVFVCFFGHQSSHFMGFIILDMLVTGKLWLIIKFMFFPL